MYKVYKGDSCDFYKKHREEVKGKAKLVYLDPPYNSKRNRGARKYYNDSNMSVSYTHLTLPTIA